MEEIKYIENLERQIEELKNEVSSKELEVEIKRKQLILDRCKDNLTKLSDNQVCYRIYVYILNGFSVTKAIEKVAEENFFNDEKPTTSNTIWKYYYPKLKKMLNVK